MKKYIRRFFKSKTIHNITKNKKLFLIMLAISTLFLGVGYAQISEIELNVVGSANAKVQPNVVITSVVYDSSTNSDPTSSIINDTNLTLMNSHIVLGNDLLSTITYKVTIKNNSDIPAVYKDAIYLEPFGYDNPNIEFVINGINPGDTINIGQKKEFTITFKYKDSLSSVTNNTLNSLINFRFNLADKVARIGNAYYESLQTAINAAHTDTMTIIELLSDTDENITIDEGKYIEILLRNNTIRNVGNSPVVENNGYLVFREGMIKNNSGGNAAINNRSTGTIILDSVTIDVTNGKQALFNENGKATITGSSYLRSVSEQRGAVQNAASGTLNIESGTIVSTKHNAVVNSGTMTIGTPDGNVQNETPLMIGRYYGITSEKVYHFYDGMAKGRNYGLNNTGRAIPETGYSIVESDEMIDGNLYYLNFPTIPVVVSFNPAHEDATVNEPTRKVAVGYKVGPLPEATRNGYDLAGWFTDPTGGEEITAQTIINSDITFYAHWQESTNVCKIGNTGFSTVSAAVNAVPDNTQTVIELQKDVQESLITIPASKDIIIDLNGHTLSNKTNKAVIESSGVLNIQNGTISTNSTTDSPININAGTLTISANVTSPGGKQAIYVISGTANIIGNPTITSAAAGTGLNSSLGRSTIQGLSGTTINILGGTIINSVQQAISCEGTLRIGTKDGNVNNSSPIIRGSTYGVVSTSTFNFYDGTIMGPTDAISGNVTDTETTLVDGTSDIGGIAYKTKNNS